MADAIVGLADHHADEATVVHEHRCAREALVYLHVDEQKGWATAREGNDWPMSGRSPRPRRHNVYGVAPGISALPRCWTSIATIQVHH